HGVEDRGGAVEERRTPAARVVALRALDLEHVGAEHRQHGSRIGTGDVARQFHDLDAVERQHGFFSYRPVKFGWRFSRKCATPSRKSAVPRQATSSRSAIAVASASDWNIAS